MNLNKALILDVVYPVGSIYMSVNSTSPASLFGGTWEQLKDRFLLGAGNTYSNGATGGEATHTLTVNEMPSHDHEVYGWGYRSGQENSGYGSMAGGSRLNEVYNNLKIMPKGGGQAHNNMPPYLVVYMYKRVA